MVQPLLMLNPGRCRSSCSSRSTTSNGGGQHHRPPATLLCHLGPKNLSARRRTSRCNRRNRHTAPVLANGHASQREVRGPQKHSKTCSNMVHTVHSAASPPHDPSPPPAACQPLRHQELKLSIPAWGCCMSWCADFEFRGTHQSFAIAGPQRACSHLANVGPPPHTHTHTHTHTLIW